MLDADYEKALFVNPTSRP